MTQYLRTTTLAMAIACIVVCLPQKGVAQDSKIAVVNTRTLTLMSDEGKVASDKLQKRLDVIRTEMDKLRKDIEDKDNNLRTRERLLSAQAKASLSKDIEDSKFRFDQKAQVYEKEMNELQGELLDPIAEKIRGELQAFVNEKSYTLVVDLAEDSNVVWANAGNDITKDVLVRVNENFKKSGGTTAPAAAPAVAPASTPKNPAATTPGIAPLGGRAPATGPGTTIPAPTTPTAPPAAPK
jgi:Skp family chaperone for outer membrane proteins